MSEPMYNESYHPFIGENCKNALEGLNEEQQAEFNRQNGKAIEKRQRDYYIVIKEPTTGNMEEGTADGIWMHIQNGQMIGSCYDR
jgi:hypothetical protein